MNRFKQSVLLFLFINLMTVPSVFSGEVRIAVAANFTNASRKLSKLFEQQTGHKTKTSYGSTGKLYAQIANGAPFDVYLSADTIRPEKAVEDGLAVAASLFVYAKGKLVLWSSDKQIFDNGESWFKQAGFKRIAIANPKTAPYGLAAKQVIQHLGNWKVVQGKLIHGDSIAQTFQFVATGNTEAGFIALSQAKTWQATKKTIGTLWEIPDGYYQPINQSAVLLNKGKENTAALAFLEFLKSAKTQKIIEGFGYGTDINLVRNNIVGSSFKPSSEHSPAIGID